MAGYFYGDMVAFEIAKKTEADGDEVKFLGSFDLPPHIKQVMNRLDWTGCLLHVAFFCALITEDRSDELAPELRLLRIIQEQTLCSSLLVSCRKIVTVRPKSIIPPIPHPYHPFPYSPD
jgi:thioesterase domain-containing protein